jgi:arylsulfatase A-like enzyme
MPDYAYCQRGIDFLQNHSGGPFCASVGFFRPHLGWYVPQRYFDLYPLDKIILPEAPTDDLNDIGKAGKEVALKWNFHDCIIRQGLWADAVRAYLACISWVDTQVGRLMQALDESPYADNTIVVLWSDHGFHLGEKFHWHKMALWEPATHVPLLIRMPQQKRSKVVQACVSLSDIAPTLLDLTHSTSDYEMDGVSLKPLLNDPSTTWNRPVLTTLNGNDHAIRTPEWRYIRYQNGEQELYDKIADPGEYHNLASDPTYAAVMSQLFKHMPTPI